MISGIVSSLSLSDSSLFMYTNATDLSILIFYSATLLNSLMNFSTFLITPIGFSMYCIMSSAHSDNFPPSFPIWIPFISFSPPISITRTSKIMLNNGQMVKMGILVSFLTLEEMLSAFHHWIWC